MKKVLLLFSILSVYVLNFPGEIYSQTTEIEKIKENIKHAKTYYWFALSEQGNMNAFRNGMKYLENAEQLVNNTNLPDNELAALSKTITELKNGFAEQMDMAHDTFNGVFPLARFIGPTVFWDDKAAGNFDFIDEPWVIAATRAVEKMTEEILIQLKSPPQFDVIFISEPMNQAMENEAAYILNMSPKFFIHNNSEIINVLNDEEFQKLRNEKVITGQMSRKLCNHFRSSAFLVVNTKEADVFEDKYFYQIDAHLYKKAQSEPENTISVMGFCRDKRNFFIQIVIIHIALLILSVVLYYIIMILKCGRDELSGTNIFSIAVLPAAGFIFGRLILWILLPFIKTVSPSAETLAKLSFWWPFLAGITIFFVPAVLFRIAISRLQPILSIFNINGKGGAVFTSIALGVSAYAISPFILYNETVSVLIFIPFIIGVVSSLYILGCSLDSADTKKISVGFIPIFFSAVFGFILCLSDVFLIISGGFLPVVFFAVTELATRAKLEKEEESDHIKEQIIEETDIPVTVQSLIERADNPPFVKLSGFDKIFNMVRPFAEENKTCRAVLTGPSGRGKSANSAALINELKNIFESKNTNVKIMKGECPEPLGENIAYAPFQKALSRCFDINLLSSEESQLRHLDSLLDEMFESVVPFSGILFPPSDEDYNVANSRKEIFISIARMIRKLASNSAVILSIDDIHWIDEESRMLLDFLLDKFPAGGDICILILLAGHDTGGLKNPDIEKHVINLNSLEREEKTQLIQKLGIEKNTAEVIVEKVDKASSKQGELFWLFHVISDFARNGILVRGVDGFEFNEQYSSPDSLPVPEKLYVALEEQLDQFPAYRRIIECAACLGAEFKAAILAESLEKPRLDILQLLDEIEKETGLIYDVKESDDIYAFQSSFILEVIRDRMLIKGEGPLAKSVPQIVREYHSRLAISLERTLDISSNEIYEVAKHYYSAGISHAEKAFRYCIKAAYSSSGLFNHDQARNFIKMAQECALALGKMTELEIDTLLLECKESHVEGTNRKDTADKCLNYIERNSDCSVKELITFALACYDAGVDTREQKYFEKAAETGTQIIKKAENISDKAEGLHFIGISLPMNEAEKRESHLREAVNILEKELENGKEIQYLYLRVLNSLAEQLSRKAPEEAKALFEKRLKLNEDWKLGDWPGKARAHGGLGRLAFFSEKPDISKAREHFEQDLYISKEIVGDVAGMSMMHSFLGGCDKIEKKWDSALDHYEISYKLASGRKDKFFALAGIFEIAGLSGKIETFEQYCTDFYMLAKEEKIPVECKNILESSQKTCEVFKNSKYYNEFTECINEFIEK